MAELVAVAVGVGVVLKRFYHARSNLKDVKKLFDQRNPLATEIKQLIGDEPGEGGTAPRVDGRIHKLYTDYEDVMDKAIENEIFKWHMGVMIHYQNLNMALKSVMPGMKDSKWKDEKETLKRFQCELIQWEVYLRNDQGRLGHARTHRMQEELIHTVDRILGNPTPQFQASPSRFQGQRPQSKDEGRKNKKSDVCCLNYFTDTIIHNSTSKSNRRRRKRKTF
jgi:hypothetical protein